MPAATLALALPLAQHAAEGAAKPAALTTPLAPALAEIRQAEPLREGRTPQARRHHRHAGKHHQNLAHHAFPPS